MAKASEDSDADAEADANVGAGGPRGRRGGGRRGDLDLGVALVAKAGRAATTHRRRVLVGDDKGDPPPSGLPEPVPPTLAPASTLLSSSRTLTSLPCLSLPQAVRRRTRVAVDVAKASEDSDTDAEADANVGAGGPRGRRGGAATTHRRRVLVGDDKGDPPPPCAQADMSAKREWRRWVQRPASPMLRRRKPRESTQTRPRGRGSEGAGGRQESTQTRP